MIKQAPASTTAHSPSPRKFSAFHPQFMEGERRTRGVTDQSSSRTPLVKRQGLERRCPFSTCQGFSQTLLYILSL